MTRLHLPVLFQAPRQDGPFTGASHGVTATVVLIAAVVLLCLDGAIHPLPAQSTGSVTGIVTSTSGVPLASVQVYVPDSPLGALTNGAGRFLLLEVPAGPVEVRAELVGHRSATRTVEVPPGQAVVVDFRLVAEAIRLEEVVVTGTGRAVERKRLGNTVATLDATKVANAPISNFSELLQAREPSVLALTSEGATGSGARLRIRGSNSISMSNEPLVYVDGIRVDNSGDMESDGRGPTTGSRLDDINWEAVERVEVLKGAAAATLYGSEASSGVIQVFTKAGSPGAGRLTARVEAGVLSTPDRIPPNAGFARDLEQASRLSTLYGEPIEPFVVFEKDFTRDILETGHFRAVAADVSGGDDEVRYYVGGRYSFEDGVLGAESLGPTRDQLTRVQGNASLTVMPRDRVTFRFAAGYTDTGLSTFRRNNNIGSAISMTQWGKPELANCARSSVDTTRTFGESTPVCTGQGNPAGTPFGSQREFMQTDDFQDAHHFRGSVSGRWEGGPGISAEALVGIDQVDEKWDRVWPFGWRVDGESRFNIPDSGLRNIDLRRHREITADVRMGWSADFGPDFESDFVVGGQRFLAETEFNFDFGAIFPAPGVQVLQAAEVNGAEDFQRSKVSMGAYVQEQLAFRNWLFWTIGARLDRSSAFGRDAGSAF
ncbi:MAG: TonB-dependent receptor plug domain-containing protein, partial [Longimicrobiales bacterium]|nr:TonB-dependent receptor plug domain-containing protein [Longimicrobiales bacterium]